MGHATPSTTLQYGYYSVLPVYREPPASDAETVPTTRSVFSNELLLHMGNLIANSENWPDEQRIGTLKALCLVNRDFNTIFSEGLYSKLDITPGIIFALGFTRICSGRRAKRQERKGLPERNDLWSAVETFLANPRLVHVKNIYVDFPFAREFWGVAVDGYTGPERFRNETRSPGRLVTLFLCRLLAKTPRLRTFHGVVLPFWAGDLGSSFSKPLEQLVRSCPRVTQLCLEGQFDPTCLDAFAPPRSVAWAVLPLQALRSVKCAAIKQPSDLWQDGLVRCLRAAPGLESLELGFGRDHILCSLTFAPGAVGFFEGLCRKYHEAGGEPLRLTELVLGRGMYLGPASNADRGSMLQRLVDLSALRTLHVWCSPLPTARATLYPGTYWDIVGPDTMPRLRNLMLSDAANAFHFLRNDIDRRWVKGLSLTCTHHATGTSWRDTSITSKSLALPGNEQDLTQHRPLPFPFGILRAVTGARSTWRLMRIFRAVAGAQLIRRLRRIFRAKENHRPATSLFDLFHPSPSDPAWEPLRPSAFDLSYVSVEVEELEDAGPMVGTTSLTIRCTIRYPEVDLKTFM